MAVGGPVLSPCDALAASVLEHAEAQASPQATDPCRQSETHQTILAFNIDNKCLVLVLIHIDHNVLHIGHIQYHENHLKAEFNF